MTETVSETANWTDEDYTRALAENRVRAGLRLLDDHAQWGWWWNCFRVDPESGSLRFCGDVRYNEENPLTLAHMDRPDLADPGTGYVTIPRAMRSVGIAFYDLEAYGLHHDADVSNELLNQTWGAILRSRIINLPFPRRHSTPIDRMFLEGLERGGFWTRVGRVINILLMRRPYRRQ